ncbi:hypothetical protein [Paenibacillus rigui]|nr:hypothetical protein [Paenibacillus rigui]
MENRGGASRESGKQDRDIFGKISWSVGKIADFHIQGEGVPL